MEKGGDAGKESGGSNDTPQKPIVILNCSESKFPIIHNFLHSE